VAFEESRQETGYKPTKSELVALFKHWWIEKQWINFDAWRLEAGISHSEWQEQMYANERMDRITEVIGEKEARKASDDAQREFKWRIGEEAWHVWTGGTPEEEAEFHRKLVDEMSK
jgi:hypothetical protein